MLVWCNSSCVSQTFKSILDFNACNNLGRSALGIGALRTVTDAEVFASRFGDVSKMLRLERCFGDVYQTLDLFFKKCFKVGASALPLEGFRGVYGAFQYPALPWVTSLFAE